MRAVRITLFERHEYSAGFCDTLTRNMAELTQAEVQALSHAMLVLETLAERLGGGESEKLRHARELVSLVLTSESIVEDALSVPRPPGPEPPSDRTRQR